MVITGGATLRTKERGSLAEVGRVGFCMAGCALGSLGLRVVRVTILFGGHAGGVLEVAVEGCRIGKTKLDGGFLERLVGLRLYHLFRQRYHILLNPFSRRDATGGFADGAREIVGVQMQFVGIELHLARLTVCIRC